MSGRWLVIGSNSFTGAHFVRFLLERGETVAGASRSPEPHLAYLPYRWDSVPAPRGIYQIDLNHDLAELMRVVHDLQPEYVVNFAAQSMVGPSWDSPTHWFQTNVVATVALHDELRRLKYLKRYVHASTPEVYGSCEGHVAEDHPMRPSTPYAVSRAAADLSLRTFVQNYGFPVVSTRSANVYGPGQRLYRVIPRTLLSLRLGRRLPLHGGGVSVRSFVHIRDVADGTWRAAVHGGVGEVYHLATRNGISIRGLVERMCVKVGVPLADVIEIVGVHAGKDLAYLLDTTKSRQALGWTDVVSLDDGIDDTLAWIDTHLEDLKSHPVDYIHKP